jgi:hypothetical protein
VNVLWLKGNLEGMLALEDLWNDLMKTYSFSLLCGYQVDKTKEEQQRHILQDICHTHSKIISSSAVSTEKR